MREADGMISKAFTVYPPLHFARQWYEKSGDYQSVAWAYEQEKQVQQEVPYLAWQSLLPLSLLSMYMGA